MKLDLGCGQAPLAGFVGVDLPDDPLAPLGEKPFQAYVDGEGIVRFDLCNGIPWPFEDDSVEELFCSHVIEHLPPGRIRVSRWQTIDGSRRLVPSGTQDALFWFLDEAWRVTRPGGKFLLRWPSLEDARTGAIQLLPFHDPTHYRFIPIAQLGYWSRKGRKIHRVEQYRARCDWGLVRATQRELVAGEGKTLLETEVELRKEP